MVMVYIFIVVLGLALGSFSNALAWRVYVQSVTKNRAKLKKLSVTKGRSMCVHCKHELSVGDLVPVFSWLFLKGKCRYCKKQISFEYPLIEILYTLALVLSYIYWPLELLQWQNIALQILWAIILIISFALASIDIKHQLLPNKLVYVYGVLASCIVVLQTIFTGDSPLFLQSLLGSAILGGIFWLLYQASSGKWIGGGDVRFITCMGLLLGLTKGFLALVLSSYLATIVIVGVYFAGKYRPKMRIPFGPFLLLATYLVFLFGQDITDLYLRFVGL